ncbi:DUF2202 domain-containing protein [Micromonospora sp. WMMC241]|uniref:ferritin-like domain-containing protein n=1 Tax=Micromonospora sp. WMMC241 TaxID=3015159 RepID=UPI0022B71622|nr:DUF2202 domain-containing protein [Micromonospora sp. WMMC241]MCZ7436680.1 DUF2202 domain-containing protein [Micromonospora sp. WMMC241]
MRTTTRRTMILVAAGALGLGGVAVAAPALAGAGPFDRPAATASPGDAWGGGMGHGARNGAGGMMGSGAMGRDGQCAGLSITAQQGALTDAQKSILAAMAQEEKLAHDLYLAFGAKYDLVVFDHIAYSEAQHLTTVRTLLQRYDVADPTASMTDGKFSDPAVQATYDKLLAEGNASQPAALGVGRKVEQTDIADLKAAFTGLSAPDVTHVYTNLLAASERHLAAFTRWT